VSIAISETWDRLQKLFHAARGLPPPQRTAFLARECGDDAELRARLETLLTEHDRPTGVLDVPMAPLALAGKDAPLPVDRRIGRYKILRVLGRGASGVVYEAQQDYPGRRVALKILHAGLASDRMVRRFEYEAELLARLNHPGIAQVLDSGTFDDDEGPRPFIAMELVEGVSLAEFARHRKLSIRQRMEFVAQICDAVDHAHQNGVIHRDLKPANVIVVGATAQGSAAASHVPDGRPPFPKIVDFGIARELVPGATRASRQTAGERFVGTLPYMSPEQLSADAPAVDRRSDVYSLGVMFYELLGGALPLLCDNANLLSAVEMIQNVEPPLLGTLRTELRGDIEIIAAKALEKDPARRYGSAGEFAADIRRHLSDEPIAARPATTMYQLRKFARRNRTLVAGATATAAALILGLFATAYMAMREASARRAAEIEQQRATAAMRAAVSQLNLAQAQITGMLEFVEQQLSDLPGATRARLELAESGIRQFEFLLTSAAEAELVREPPDMSLSYAHQRVGEALLAVGDAAAALDSFDRTLEFRRRVVAAAPLDSFARRALGVAHWKVGDAFLRLDQPHAALIQMLEANALMHDLDARGTLDSFGGGTYLGLAHRRLAAALEQLGDYPSALAQFAEAAADFREACRADPRNREPIRGLAESLTGQARLQLALAAIPEACETAGAAVETTRLLRRLSVAPGASELLLRARALHVRSAAERKLNNAVSAEESSGEAIEIARTLRDRDPDNADFARLLAECTSGSLPGPAQ
jgi:eukaryotic-like serine/threonine-protein kinase